MRTSKSDPNRGNRKSWVVVHNAARDQYQLPIALAEGGLLERFVTDWYTPKDRIFWRKLVQLNTHGSKLGLQSRYRQELSSSLVMDQKFGFLMDLFYRKLFRKPFQDLKAGAKIGRKAAALANRRSANLFATSYCGGSAFSHLHPDAKRVLFQVHPQPRYLRALYRKTLSNNTQGFAGLENEAEMQASDSDLLEWEKESSLAQFVVCASSFTKKSLVASGIPPERIEVIAYGVDTEVFQPNAHRTLKQPFTVLYVGQKIARKNLGGLLQAWKTLQPRDARLVVAGGHIRDAQLVDSFQGTYEEVPRIDLTRLIELFQSADLFVLPSIAEGFGHVYLESLSCGTPILCTDNTGGPDIIADGESGWIVPSGDQAALTDRLAWCLHHRETVRSMREAARSVAERHTWHHFRSRLRAHLAGLAA